MHAVSKWATLTGVGDLAKTEAQPARMARCSEEGHPFVHPGETIDESHVLIGCACGLYQRTVTQAGLRTRPVTTVYLPQ